MVLKIIRKGRPQEVTIIENTPNGVVKRVVKKSKKVKPHAPEISLLQPGRLRVANLMSLFGVSRTTLYMGIDAGRYPMPDGKDGRLPYWNTETIKKFLDK